MFSYNPFFKGHKKDNDISVCKVLYFKSLTRLQDFFKKSCKTFKTFETWKIHYEYSVTLFNMNPKGHNFKKYLTILSPESFLMHFYASIFIKCQNFCIFCSNFPAKIIQNHKIISFETFWKSLTRLSRLLKVLSWPRLSRLANANHNIH